MYAMLGEIPFEITESFTTLTMTHDAKFAHHEVIQGKPRTQALGLLLAKLKFSLRLHWRLGDVAKSYQVLHQAFVSQDAQALVTGSGQMMGFYTIGRLSVTTTAQNDTGDTLAMDIDVDLTEFIGDPTAPNPTPAIATSDSVPLLSLKDDSINAPIDIETASLMADVGAWTRSENLLNGISSKLALLGELSNDPARYALTLSEIVSDGSTVVKGLSNIPALSAYADRLGGVGSFGGAVADTLGKVGVGIGAVQSGNLTQAKTAFTGAMGAMSIGKSTVSKLTAKIASKKPLKGLFR
ncbi:Phage P2 GpU [Moraxella cuniculi DSM 21768]|uniref:Phage P2 GpU n=1 Tax=Moraxella cuniculi DSM 21768 TaxID=1122245 RepID=A0A1N7DIK1_9GAMM|nr:phage tail protein [Moraxella cuniculi]OOS08086.1 hypothetical protein B0189_01770 [Moraxella cuniculi]SIR75628.1 Phage P2 GpU [Moraxella cuniculi DSM 21768]